MSAIRCVGGPLDGQFVSDYGELMKTIERIKPDFGETIAFGAPSVNTAFIHEYRKGRLVVDPVHEKLTGQAGEVFYDYVGLRK